MLTFIVGFAVAALLWSTSPLLALVAMIVVDVAGGFLAFLVRNQP
jgi:hypothetical protein